MDDKDSLPTYIEMRPPHFDPHKIIVYLDHYDKNNKLQIVQKKSYTSTIIHEKS